MNTEELAVEIIKNEEDIYPYLHRSFIDKGYASTITKRLNEEIENSPELRDTIYAVIMYPAIKWAAAHEKIGDSLLDFAEQNDSDMSAQIKISAEIVTYETTIDDILQKRAAYFNACRNLASKIEEALSKIRMYPQKGEKLASILSAILGITECTSRHDIDKYLKNTLTVFSRFIEPAMSDLDIILTGAMPSNDDADILCGETLSTLSEYTCLIWQTNNIKERDVTANDKLYLELMRDLIGSLKKFPRDGKIYHSIANTIIDLKPLGISDEAAAERLDISTFTYSIKKRRTLIILGSLLFGCSGDMFMKILADKI